MAGQYLGFEHAVDTVAHAQESGFRFEMHIGGAAFDRVGEQGVD